MTAVIVKPLIFYPLCMREGKAQDCFNCVLKKYNRCVSPRGLCVRPYPNHPKGCPNYGKKKSCPPTAKMFDEVYDISKPVYAIYTTFDFGTHVAKMREAHPDWSQRQLECCLYWQGAARAALKQEIVRFLRAHQGEGFRVETCPEAMGVNLTDTMLGAGINIEWPPVNQTHHIALAAIPLPDK